MMSFDGGHGVLSLTTSFGAPETRRAQLALSEATLLFGEAVQVQGKEVKTKILFRADR